MIRILPLMVRRKRFVLSGKRVFLIAREIPALVMFEGDGIHHRGEKQNENDLRQNVETDLNATDFFGRLCGVVSSAIRHSLHLRDWNA